MSAARMDAMARAFAAWDWHADDGADPSKDPGIGMHTALREVENMAPGFARWALAEIAAADASLEALGVENDGRPLAERVEALEDFRSRGTLEAEVRRLEKRAKALGDNPDNGRQLICSTCGEVAWSVCTHIANQMGRAYVARAEIELRFVAAMSRRDGGSRARSFVLAEVLDVIDGEEVSPPDRLAAIEQRMAAGARRG